MTYKSNFRGGLVNSIIPGIFWGFLLVFTIYFLRHPEYIFVLLTDYKVLKPSPFLLSFFVSILFIWLKCKNINIKYSGTRLLAKVILDLVFILDLVLLVLLRYFNSFEIFPTSIAQNSFIVTASIYIFMISIWFTYKYDLLLVFAADKKLLLSMNFPKLLLFIYSIFLIGLCLARYSDLSIAKPDAEIMVQVMSNFLSGKGLTTSMLGDLHNWFGLHFEPFLLPLAYILFLKNIILRSVNDLFVLQVVQAVTAIGCVYYFYKLSKIILKSVDKALLVSVVFALYPAFIYQSIFDFHIEMFGILFLILGLTALEEARWLPLLFWFLLAGSTREDFLLFGFVFSFLLFFRKRRFILSFFYLIITLASSFLIRRYIISYFSHGINFYGNAYAYLGTGLINIIQNIKYHPEILLNEVINFKKLQYILLIFIPVGFIPIISPYILVVAPFLGMNLLVKGLDLPTSIFMHYQSSLIVATAYLVIIALETRSVKYYIYLAMCSLLSFFLIGPMNYTDLSLNAVQKGGKQLESYPEAKYIAAMKYYTKDCRSISISPKLISYFGNFTFLYLFPDRLNAECILITKRDYIEYIGIERRFFNDGYKLRNEGGLMLFSKELGEKEAVVIAEKQIFNSKSVDNGDGYKLIKTFNAASILLEKPDGNFSSWCPKNKMMPAILEYEIKMPYPTPSKNSDGIPIFYLIPQMNIETPDSFIRIEVSKNGKRFRNLYEYRNAIGSNKRYSPPIDITNFVDKNKRSYIRLTIYTNPLENIVDVCSSRIEQLLLITYI